MTIKEIIVMINGTKHRSMAVEKIHKLAAENGIVIVFGASDDLMEFRGAIYDEECLIDGGEVFVRPSGLVKQPECDCQHAADWFNNAKKDSRKIEALWCRNIDRSQSEISWQYKTEIPHETFVIMDDGRTYCRGIAFKVSDIR